MSVTIADQPVLVDYNEEIQAWIDKYFHEFRAFEKTEILDSNFSGQPYSKGDYFRLNLPELPKIEIGQLQWPCVGASRFARALFLVDKHALRTILAAAWGTGVDDGTIPNDWNQQYNVPVPVLFPALEPTTSGGTPPITIAMFCLLPTRISNDVWLLPLVDNRYYANYRRALFETGRPDKKWSELFSAINLQVPQFDITFAGGTPYEATNPDIAVQTSTVPIQNIIDSACFSVGDRPVVLMNSVIDGKIKVVCEPVAAAIVKKTTLLEKPKITGGVSPNANKPSSITVATRFSPDYFCGTDETYSYFSGIPSSVGPGNWYRGAKLFAKSLFNVISIDGSTFGYKDAFEDYVDSIAEKISAWSLDEYDITLPGYVELVPSGFDDLITYDSQKGVTLVRSLPIDYFPPYMIAQYPANDATSSTLVQCQWFFTERETVPAKTLGFVAAGGIDGTTGMRKFSPGIVQLHDASLFLNVGSTFAKALVTVLNPANRSIPGGTLVHLAWVRQQLYGNSPGATVPYEGWVIDWVDC